MNRVRLFVNHLKTVTPSSSESTNNVERNVEISEANFSFQVPNFNKENVTLLPLAHVRHLPWTIMLKVNESENDTNVSLSVFLICDYNNNNYWSCDANIKLKLLSYNSHTNPYVREFKHCFEKNYFLKGCDPFILWSELMDSGNEYVRNNKIVMEVFMKCDEPKGVAWNSKKHTGFVGVVNKNGKSYFNSIIQILYCIEPFRNAIIDLSSEIKGPHLLWAIKHIFGELQSSETTISIDELIKSMGECMFNYIGTSDTKYFFKLLHKMLEEEQSTKAISELFHVQLTVHSTRSGNFELTELKKLYSLNVNVSGQPDVNELLSDYFASDNNFDQENSLPFFESSLLEISTLNRWLYSLIRCTNRLHFEKRVEIVHLPTILIIHLNRQQQINLTGTNNPDEIKFLKTINLSKYMKKCVESSQSSTYLLHAVLVRCETFSTFINNEIGWLKFDNDVVSHCTEKEAIEDNFKWVQMLVYLKCSRTNTNNATDDSVIKCICIICMETPIIAERFSTICGHVFCGRCIKMEISLRRKCPICKNDLTENEIHPIYI